eukprot:m.759564 g.759564  ORF g.759564 m.759564 type:complete len:89 (-) comp23197_c0_seq6:1749-2015(-)
MKACFKLTLAGIHHQNGDVGVRGTCQAAEDQFDRCMYQTPYITATVLSAFISATAGVKRCLLGLPCCPHVLQQAYASTALNDHTRRAH